MYDPTQIYNIFSELQHNNRNDHMQVGEEARERLQEESV